MSKYDASIKVMDMLKELVGEEEWTNNNKFITINLTGMSFSIKMGPIAEVPDNAIPNAFFTTMEPNYDFQGVFHPVDGMCHANNDTVDAQEGTCVHCGRTLM